MNKKDLLILGLTIALTACLVYIFVYPAIITYFVRQAEARVVNNLLTQLQTQGYVLLRINNQSIALIPQALNQTWAS